MQLKFWHLQCNLLATGLNIYSQDLYLSHTKREKTNSTPLESQVFSISFFLCRSLWGYGGFLDSLILSVDKDVRLYGVQHFGREGCEYTVSMEIKDATSKISLAKKSGTYCSEKDLDHLYYGFDILFDSPVILESVKRYEISSMIRGPPSYYGGKGQTSVNFEGINFTFSRLTSPYKGTNEKGGQFPAFLFTHSR